MKIVIIEDEELAAEKLNEFVKRYNTDFEVIKNLRSVRECMEWFENNPMPDLISVSYTHLTLPTICSV